MHRLRETEKPGCSRSACADAIALRVAERLTKRIQSGKQRCSTAQDLIDLVLNEARRYLANDAVDSVSLNACRRVLRIVRDEAALKIKGGDSMQAHLLDPDAGIDYGAVPADQIRGQIVTSIGELTAELENSVDELARHGAQHVRPGEIVLTLGYSHSVLRVLREAAKKGGFEVIVCDAGPNFTGREMAKALREVKGILCSEISDCHLFAVMARVHRCLLSAQTVFADGGLRADCGTHGLLLAAGRHSVPALVCAPTYTVAPAYYNVERNNQYLNPGLILPEQYSFAEVHCPKFDLVPPGLVTLFVTNQGGLPPSYLHRCLSEQYHPDDFIIVDGGKESS